jgi:mRNA-degrading endonuclease RelE of RelBE toxin-antitoxin system
MAVRVVLLANAKQDIDALPLTVKARVLDVVERLAKWPDVSGAKPMRGKLKGHYRIRTGDWRVLFHVIAPDVIIVRVAHRRDVYDA